jgi:hypothetical protein
MMEFVYRAFLGILLLAATATPAMGADTPDGRAAIALADHIVPHVNSWATLQIALPRIAGRSISVAIEDGRGGPIVRRRLRIFRRHILMPLPYIAGAGGLGGNWPVIVKIGRAGKILRVLHLGVELPLAGATHAATIAVPHVMTSQFGALTKAFNRRLTPVFFSRHQFALSPVLNLASCRWMLLSPATAHQLSHRRVMALLSLGVRLICVSTKPPDILPASAWHNSGSSGKSLTLWTTPRFDGFIHGPPVVIAHLAAVRIPPLHAPASWKYAAWAIGPLTIIMLILLRWAVMRRWYFILSLGIGVTLLSVAAILWLATTTGVVRTRYQWQTFLASGPLSVKDTVTMNRSLHRTGWVTGRSDAMTLPLAWSVRSWLAFHGIIDVHRNTAALTYQVSRRATILDYQLQAATSRYVARYPMALSAKYGELKKGKFSSDSGVLFSAGQVFLPSDPDHARDFFNWLSRQSLSTQATLHLWLRLQFNSRHKYYFIPGRHGTRIVAFPG